MKDGERAEEEVRKSEEEGEECTKSLSEAIQRRPRRGRRIMGRGRSGRGDRSPFFVIFSETLLAAYGGLRRPAAASGNPRRPCNCARSAGQPASSPCTVSLVICSTLASLIVCAYSSSTLLTSLALAACYTKRSLRSRHRWSPVLCLWLYSSSSGRHHGPA